MIIVIFSMINSATTYLFFLACSDFLVILTGQPFFSIYTIRYYRHTRQRSKSCSHDKNCDQSIFRSLYFLDRLGSIVHSSFGSRPLHDRLRAALRLHVVVDDCRASRWSVELQGADMFHLFHSRRSSRLLCQCKSNLNIHWSLWGRSRSCNWRSCNRRSCTIV